MARGRPVKPGAGPYRNRLLEVRSRLGATQEQVGRVLGISYVHVGRLERGEARLTAEQTIALAQFFNVSPQEFVATDRESLAVQIESLSRLMTRDQLQTWLQLGTDLLANHRLRDRASS